jgi:drug/metabolite transporter (DMT)-like permease
VGVAVLGEPLTGLQITAFAIALTGVVLATLPGPGQAAATPVGPPH